RLLLSSYPIKERRLSFTAPVLLETLQRTPPVNWRPWVTQECVTMPRVSKTGLTPASRSRATTGINLRRYRSAVAKCIEVDDSVLNGFFQEIRSPLSLGLSSSFENL